MKSLYLTTAPTVEPVTPEEAMAHLRVDDAAEEPSIEAYIAVARSMVENFTGRALVTQSWRLTLPAWPCDSGEAGRIIELDRTPLASVESVKYYPADGSAQATLATSAYLVVTDAKPGLVYLKTGETWPALATRPDAVTVAFTSGAADVANVPAVLRHAILLLVSHLYDLRAPVNVGNIVNEIPFSLKHLMESQRVGGWCA